MTPAEMRHEARLQARIGTWILAITLALVAAYWLGQGAREAFQPIPVDRQPAVVEIETRP